LMGYSVPLKSNRDSNNDASTKLENPPKNTSGRAMRRRVLRSNRAASSYYSDRSMNNSSLSSFHYELENSNYYSCNENEESGEGNDDIYQSLYNRNPRDRSVYSDSDSYDSDDRSTTRQLDEMESSTRSGNSEINSVDGSWSMHNLAADQHQSDFDAASNPFQDRSQSGRKVSSIKIPVASLDCHSNSTNQTYNREESAKLLCMEGDDWDNQSQPTFHDEDEDLATAVHWDMDNDGDMGSLPSRASMMPASRRLQRQNSEQSITLTGEPAPPQRPVRKMYKQSSELSISIADRRQMFKQNSEHSISLFGGSQGSDDRSMSDDSDGLIRDDEIFQDALMQFAEPTQPTVFQRRRSSGDYTLSLSGNGEEDYDASQKSIRPGRRCSLTSINGSGIDTSCRSRAISTISEDSFEITGEELGEELDRWNHSAEDVYSPKPASYQDSDSDSSFYSSSEEFYDSDDSEDEGKKVKEGLLWGIGGLALGAVVGWVAKAIRKQTEPEVDVLDEVDTLGQSFAQSVLDDSINFTGTDQLLAYASMGGDGGASGELLVAAFHASGTLETTIATTATAAAAPTTTAATAGVAAAATTQTMAVTAAGNVGGVAVATATAVSQSAVAGASVGAGLGGLISVGGGAATGALAAVGLTGSGASTAAVMGSAIGAMAVAGSTYYSSTVPNWAKQPTKLGFATGICPHPNPDNQTGTIIISIDVSGMEGADEEWGWMPSFDDIENSGNSSGELLKEVWEELFISQYNNITDDGCNEIYERRVSDAMLVSSIHTGISSDGEAYLETEWEVDVMCWEKCPSEPVFGSEFERSEFERRLEPATDKPSSDIESNSDDTDGSDESEESDEPDEPKSFISMMDFQLFFENEVHAAAEAAGWEKPFIRSGGRARPVQETIPEEAPVQETIPEEAPVQETIPEEAPVQENTNSKNPGQGKKGQGKPGTDKPNRYESKTPYIAPTSPPTFKPTFSPTGTPTSSAQPSTSPSGSPNSPPSPQPSDLPSGSPTVPYTEPPTQWPTESPTISPSQSPTLLLTEIPTESPTEKPSESPTRRSTDSPTISLTDVPTESPTVSPTVSPTETVHLIDVLTKSQTQSPTESQKPTETASPVKSPSGDNPTTTTHPSLSANSQPSHSPSGSSIDDSSSPRSTPIGTKPSGSSSPNPSKSPSNSPSDEPSASPSQSPSDSPSVSPSSSPSRGPSASPSESPSDSPSVSPSSSPSRGPSASPSDSPSGSSTSNPSSTPSDSPSSSPSVSPTESPTSTPSGSPSRLPSESPSGSYFPSNAPTDYPTASAEPSASPSTSPTSSPIDSPTSSPTKSPSFAPSASPSQSSSGNPSGSPSDLPSSSPSSSPSFNPSFSPTASPSASPSTVSPSDRPNSSPSTAPTISPMSAETTAPTRTMSPNIFDRSEKPISKACCSLKLDECFSCPTVGTEEAVTEETCREKCGFVSGTLIFLEEGPPKKGSCLPRWKMWCNADQNDCCWPATCRQIPGEQYHQCLAPDDEF